ncbi:carbohydrate-binding module family 1 protein [Amniculicola lignicola CBS 123094]|uniref:Carbohydrate-binding module family 1 protein n=1 Tax=Amniculicola lignicola CBS 123094 TaxID=1392246 RepID=A0A6A5WWC1_9PLEO|nr:carbohydrate-binding module family 1 protein [Amniculicola lignicola CBS 123094]
MGRFLLSVFLAIVAVTRAEPQRDVTFTITCLGPQCTNNPPTTLVLPTTIPDIPGGGPSTTLRTTATPPPLSSSTKRTSATPPPPSSSTKKTSATPPPPSSTKKTSAPPPVSSTPTKTTKKPTQTGGETGPSSTKCPVPLYYQCDGYYDGKPWTGCTNCVSGAKCVEQNDYYWQCVAA